MRTRRALVAAAVAVTVAVATPAVAAASSVPRGAAPSDTFCAAITDHYKLGFLIALASAFAQVGDDDKKSEEAVEEITNTLQLVLSPKLEQVTTTLAEEAPTGALAKVFRRHAKAYKQGVKALRDAGVSDEAIDALSRLDENADPDSATQETGISDEQLKLVAKKWGREFGDDLDTESLPGTVAADYADAGGACGVFPDRGVQCKEIVSRADVKAVIGTVAKSEDEGGSCTYESKDPSDGEPDKVVIDVYKSPRAFDTLTEGTNVQNQSVPDLGDEAVALEGINSFTSSSTCGRTIVVRDGDRTVVVGACTRDEDVDISDVTHLTEQVLEKVADL